MLVALSIRDIVLIERLDLAFGPSLTVFTGETGAGKSIVLDSLSLALGSRGNSGLVRKGAAQGTVTASFEMPPGHAILDRLKSQGLDDGDSLILRRVQFADGRTKAFINDRPASTAFLHEIGSALVEFHGQHDERALLDPSSHRALLDSFGGLGPEAEAVSTSWRTWRDLKGKADALKAGIDAARRHADYLKASCEELDALAPQDGEEEMLAGLRQGLLSSAKLRADLETALEALSGQNFPSSKLATILRRLERQSALPEAIKQILSAIERVMIEAEEARSLLEAELQAESEQNVEAIEERLFALRAAARKYRVPVSELSSLHARMAAELSALETGAERLDALTKALTAAAKDYAKVADALSERRKAAARKLDAAVQKELKPLKLEKARFTTLFSPIGEDETGLTGGPFGRETVNFFVATNPGAEPGPLMKIASGGELARFLLALKVVLAERNTAPVLVFDEIDTGVGGATASAIGERLARLGSGAQVLAVTHSPQVAAQADAHYRLYKMTRGAGDNIVVETCVELLDEAGRREEIARMLAGHKITQEARAAAARLIGSKHEAA